MKRHRVTVATRRGNVKGFFRCIRVAVNPSSGVQGDRGKLRATANAALSPGQSAPMSLRSDFYALPLLHRIVILIASIGFAFLCGVVTNIYQESG